ncbi:MAG: DUF5050 domain-containing protein, partial [Clostridiales bacterium]|nr:DUF5050 domain-containing protein [Clostridiales bacterium]
MKKRGLFTAILIVLCILCFKTYNPENSSGETYLNSSGNIHNGGFIIKTDSAYYYTNHNDNDKLYKKDPNGENAELIAGNKFYYEISLLNGYIYCISGSPGKIYKISPETGRKKLLVNKLASSLTLTEKGMYYILSEYDDWGKLYFANLNGRKRRLIAQNITRFSVTGDDVYYINSDDGNSIWKYDAAEKKSEKIIDCGASDIVSDEGSVYYTVKD